MVTPSPLGGGRTSNAPTFCPWIVRSLQANERSVRTPAANCETFPPGPPPPHARVQPITAWPNRTSRAQPCLAIARSNLCALVRQITRRKPRITRASAPVLPPDARSGPARPRSPEPPQCRPQGGAELVAQGSSGLAAQEQRRPSSATRGPSPNSRVSGEGSRPSRRRRAPSPRGRARRRISADTSARLSSRSVAGPTPRPSPSRGRRPRATSPRAGSPRCRRSGAPPPWTPRRRRRSRRGSS